MLPLFKHSLCAWREPHRLGFFIGHARHSYLRNMKSERKSSIFCSTHLDEPCIPSDIQLANAKVVYSVALATGHNQESHPESNLRVPAIVDILEKMELTPKYRSSEVIELKHFNPASVEDISSVHERAYVLGLEKVMEKVSEKGILLIEGSGPTYATASTFQDSLIAAGAGLAVVDAVGIFRWLHLKSLRILHLVLL